MMFRILSALALACALSGAAVAQDDKAKQEAPKVSGGERDAAQKIEKAKGTEAKLQQAVAFVKKYPESPLRRRIAEALAQEIAATTDQQAKGSLAQTFLEIFNKPEEAPLVTATLLNSYINTGQTQDAMTLGAKWLAEHPDDITVMQNLTILASAQAIKGNNAFVAQGRDYGAKAIALLEADKMPAGFDAAKWPDFKKQALVSLYRETGVIALKSGDNAAALPLLEKAIALGTNDAAVYFIVSDLHNDIYEDAAKSAIVASAADKPAATQKAEAALDRVIESYARAIAFTDGKADFAQANAAFRERMTPYYKYRHKNSTDGMQQLIDKYKKPAQ
jgi:type III secretion system FlhB-like substrate exporter